MGLYKKKKRNGKETYLPTRNRLNSKQFSLGEYRQRRMTKFAIVGAFGFKDVRVCCCGCGGFEFACIVIVGI